MKGEPYWNDERLRQAMLDEARRHGARQRDLEQLKAQPQKAEEIKAGNDDTSIQIGEIPS